MHVVKTDRKPIETILIKLRSYKINPRKVFGIITTLAILAGLPIAANLVQKNQDIRRGAQVTSQCKDGIDNDEDGTIDFVGTNPDAECANEDDNTETPDCSGIVITPEKPVYSPGEQVTITVNTSGTTSDIHVFWDQSTRNLIREKQNYSVVGTMPNEISGNYDNNLKSWSGTLTIPKNGEYIVYSKIYSNGKNDPTRDPYCSGNPAFPCPNCNKGAVDKNNPEFIPSYSCQSCYKTFAVDSYANYTQGPDLASYWNLNPGNSLYYQGVNRFSTENSSVIWHALNSIENKVSVCGLTLTPWRMTKDSDLAYNWPNRNWQRRIFMSVFEDNQPWQNNSLGKPLAHDYQRNPSDGTFGLGTVGTEVSVLTSSDGSRAALERSSSINMDNLLTQPVPVEFKYFSPHYFTKRYVPNGWMFDWVEHFQDTTTNPFTNCDWSYKPGGERYIKNAVYFVKSIPTGLGTPLPTSAISAPNSVQPPAYTGPGIVVKFLECGSEDCKNPGSWMTREDWYLAPGIGRVRLDQKPTNDPQARQVCATGDINSVNHPCFGDMYTSSPMNNPTLSMEVISYYNGGKLDVRVVNQNIPTNGKLELNVKTPQGLPYTGWLESKSCVGDTPCTPNIQFKWAGWVQNGYGFVDYPTTAPNIEPGTRHSYFRPWVESAPSPGETLLAKPELDWSDEVVFTITDSSTIPPTPSPIATPVSALPCATGFSFSCSAINATTSTAKITWNPLVGAERYIVRVNKEPLDQWVADGDIWAWADKSEYIFTAENGKRYDYDIQAVAAGETAPFSGARCPWPPKDEICPAPAAQPTTTFINSASNKSCNQKCSELGRTCKGVGTDTNATNGKYSLKSRLFCTSSGAGCNSVMYSRNATCSGKKTFWTYCRCQ